MLKYFITVFSLCSFGLFADEVEAGTRTSYGFMQTIIMIVLFLFIFYLMLWRPEQRRRKKLDAQRSSLKIGDKVTAMGIIGIVSEIKEKTIILKMIDGAKIEFLQEAISSVQNIS